MTGELVVRQAVIEDLPRVVEIFDAYRQYFGQKSDPAGVEKFLFDRFEHRESVMFLAREGGAVRGFAHLYPSFSSLTLQRVWILNDFFIEEGCRRGGIGGKLFAAVKAYAQATRSKGIELTVEHTNVRGWTFWEKQGFRLDTEFRVYFLKLPVEK
jgi:GNAT superfamily N-acetyltransferase